MRYAYTVAQTRRLEEAAFAVVGDAALMQRAAHGLSVSAADLLVRTRGAVYGARVLILVGPGNNGGDALYAGQRLARRGCAGDRRAGVSARRTRRASRRCAAPVVGSSTGESLG